LRTAKLETGSVGKSPQLVIFDCDGVLVDSEPLALRVLLECLGDTGLDLSPEDAQRRFLGRSIASTCAILSKEFGIDLQRSHLATMRSRLHDLFRRELKPITGIAEVLDQLSGLRCVASSSQLERVILSLEVTGLLDKLEPHIFSATMVDEGKPAPDLFIYAASQLGVDNNACIVVEDSPAGIEAAKRAGMRVLAFTGGTHARGTPHLQRLLEQQPNLVFDDMRRLPMILGDLSDS
jgi:HAD superfamily hydrolase (TIGR01509 family)